MIAIDRTQIEKLIPQREPILMVHGLKEHNEKESLSFFTVEENQLFVKDNCLQAPGLVENIAQTAAARAGYSSFLTNEDPKIGFIGAITQLTIQQLPKVGSIIETKVEEVTAFMNVCVVKGSSSCDGIPLASCEMKIFIQENA